MRLLLLWVLGFLISCNSGQSQAVDAQAFEKGISEEKPQLLDVRTKGEFQRGHIENSLLADWNDREEFVRRTSFLDKNKPVYVYCAAGPRSTAASAYLRENGFTNVVELKGGFTSWRKNDLPYVAEEKVKEISQASFQDSINAHPVVLVDFGAPWCPPCRKMEPVLSNLEKEAGEKIRIVRVNADEATQLMKDLEVETLPTFIIYNKGKETWRKKGTVPLEELKKELGI